MDMGIDKTGEQVGREYFVDFSDSMDFFIFDLYNSRIYLSILKVNVVCFNVHHT